jgi:hypothetical protein
MYASLAIAEAGEPGLRAERSYRVQMGQAFDLRAAAEQRR